MSNQTATVAKAAAIPAGLFTLLATIPQPYATWVSYVLAAMAAIGMIATVIPAPDEGSKWMPLYRVLQFLASNYGEAINESQTLRGKN